MASKQQHPPPEAEGPAVKRARPEAPSNPLNRVAINPADCNLDFDVDGNGLQGHALHEKGFAYCWSGARATVGIRGGKYCFGCKIISEQVVDMEDTPPDQQHLCRAGISRGDDPVGNLGESEHSFGFGGTGKFSNAGKFSDYGTKFGIGDTIVCAVNLENSPALIGFSKNGKWLGTAKQFDASSRGIGIVDTPMCNLPWASALFPHVLLKNVVVQLQFSIEDGLIPVEGYKPWNSALGDGNGMIGPSFSSPKECEVLMMVGLPASGKTTWAEKWVKEHPEKRYVLLGTNLALEQMKVPGLLRKQNYGERFDRLMDRATGIFNTWLARAVKTPRNYVLDQTNVYRSARNRKLKSFVNYRKVAVVVFPTPNDLKSRAEKRFKEMGKEVPAEAVNEMLANYSLPLSKDMPGSNESFDEVMFPELNRGEAQRYLDEMKRALGSPNLNAKRDFSPYSRESSIQSLTSPSAVSNEAASAAGGRWQNSRSPVLLPDHSNRISQQVSPVYSMSGSHREHEFSSGEYQSRFGDPSLSFPSNRPYESNYGRTALHRDELDSRGSYDPSVPYSRPTFERSSIPMNDAGPYRTYGITDPYGRPEFESPSSSGRLNYGSPRTPPSYNSPGAHFRDPRVTQADRQAARAPPFDWHSPLQTNGSPYATPPPKPPRGNPPPTNYSPGSWYR